MKNDRGMTRREFFAAGAGIAGGVALSGRAATLAGPAASLGGRNTAGIGPARPPAWPGSRASSWSGPIPGPTA
jgi:hypothetical protein